MRQIKLVLLLIMVATTMFSQGRKDEIRQKIESKKIAFISERLDLTPEKSQTFWPLYNAYNKDHEALGANLNLEGMSADEKLDVTIKVEQEKLNLKKEYISKFKKVLGSEKTLDFFHFEREFRGRMLKEISDKRRNKQFRGK